MSRQPAVAGGPAAELEQRIGYQFANPALLREALTHSSAVGRSRQVRRSNERLEFLGDRVLGLVIAHLLIRRFPKEGEGALSRRHAALVRREPLAEIAIEIALGQCLVLARGEDEGGGRSKPATLANGLEALIGALYLDGGLPAAERLIRRHWGPRLRAMRNPPRDAKTTLQEWAQGRGLGVPDYQVVEVAGPAHAPRFKVVVSVADLPAAKAVAGSKRAAEQAAAEQLLGRLSVELETADG